MRKNLFIMGIMLNVCIVCAGFAFAQGTADVSGEWEINLEFSLGNATHTAVIEQEGDALSGTYKGQYLEGTLSGTVEGNEVDFTATLRHEAKRFRFHFMGTVEGDTITWRDDYHYDEMNVDWTDYWRGKFTAKREK